MSARALETLSEEYFTVANLVKWMYICLKVGPHSKYAWASALISNHGFPEGKLVLTTPASLVCARVRSSTCLGTVRWPQWRRPTHRSRRREKRREAMGPTCVYWWMAARRSAGRSSRSPHATSWYVYIVGTNGIAHQPLGFISLCKTLRLPWP